MGEGGTDTEGRAAAPRSDLDALMGWALDGDRAAYVRLLEALRARLLSYFGRRLGADPGQVEDLVQETLIAIHTRRATFDRALPVTAWAYAIARYKLVDHYRRLGRRIHVPLDEAEDLAAEDDIGAADARGDLRRALDVLPERTRDLVASVKLREEPVAEVARRTGLSESAVKVAVHRGFKRLVSRLRDEGGWA